MVLAGNIELIVFTLGSMVAWTGSYVFRVANKVRALHCATAARSTCVEKGAKRSS